MDENFKKNQEFMLKSQSMTMERQLQMQNLMREKQMAMQIATRREMFSWWAAFYALVFPAMLVGFKHSRKPGAIAPLLPLTFIVAYQYDFAYGTKIERVKAMADGVLGEEQGLLSLPAGIPTLEEIDRRCKESK